MNRDQLAAIVEELCELPGPAGTEDAVRDWLLARWAPSVAELNVGSGGNLFARVGGSGRKVTLVAHMDEVGYFVTVLREDGLIEADPLRTWPPAQGRAGQVPIGHPARVITRDGSSVLGTFATATGHVATDSAAESSWWIDVGCTSGTELADLGIHIGAPVVSAAPVRRLGNRLIGKSMDDRALLAAITALIERPALAPRNDLRIVATVQEEIGSVGAASLGAAFASDICLTLDIAPCGKLPGQPADRFPVDLGLGPVLVHKDISMVYDSRVGREIWSAAAEAGRPLQEGAFRAYQTDGRELARYGARVGLLALPCRYTHSSFETIDLEDLEALIDVLAEWV
jgi:putative aminopeptidase FrvX